MTHVTCRLVTIIAEPVLEDRLTRELASLGARGWTVTDSRGSGSRQLRASDEGAGIRLETIVSEAIAEQIVAHVAAHYFASYAVIAWTTSVDVVRGEKYV
jgi:nitrogen regulatory protein PII